MKVAEDGIDSLRKRSLGLKVLIYDSYHQIHQTEEKIDDKFQIDLRSLRRSRANIGRNGGRSKTKPVFGEIEYLPVSINTYQ